MVSMKAHFWMALLTAVRGAATRLSATTRETVRSTGTPWDRRGERSHRLYARLACSW
jgi:hypothetical protein